MVSVSSTNVSDSSCPSITAHPFRKSNMIRVRGKRCARWRLTLSRNAVVGWVWVRMQPHAARHDVAGQICQPPVMSISVSAEPDKSLRDADAELLGEHAGGLIDLGAMQGQVRRLAARARPCRRIPRSPVLGVEQAQR